MPTQTWSTGRQTARTSSRTDAGFTLIELIVVMSLMAVVSLAALPAWQQFSHNWTLRGAVMSFTSLLRYAQLNAVEQAQERRVIVDCTTGVYRLAPVPPEDATDPADSVADTPKATNAWEVPRTLPSTVHVQTSAESSDAESEGLVEIIFRPDGTATATVLQMGNENQTYRLEIRAATGAVQTTRESATEAF